MSNTYRFACPVGSQMEDVVELSVVNGRLRVWTMLAVDGKVDHYATSCSALVSKEDYPDFLAAVLKLGVDNGLITVPGSAIEEENNNG